MNCLRKLLWLLVCLLWLPAARGQVAVISSQVIDQNGQPLPFAQVRVCSVTSTGVPCTPTAAIFQDYGLTIPAANPTTADQYGNFTIYAGILPAPNLYTVQFSPASGVTWAYVYNGPFLSAAGGTVTGFINALGYNGVPEADQCSGTDAFAKINTCAALIPNGGHEDARGFGATTQTVTTQLTALANPARPITLEINQATRFILNNSFSPGSINTGVTTGVSGATGACIAPIANASALIVPGGNSSASQFNLGPLAQTYDVVCNAQMDGTQESFVIDGLTIHGNASATMAGSLLHDRHTFAGTRIENVTTYAPYGNSVTVDGGSDQYFANDNFNDSISSGGYPGAVLNLNCTSNLTFVAGAVQNNGANNPVLVASGINPNDAACPAGAGVGANFYGTDFEILPATVGSFSGHATNVDPIQLTDAAFFTIDNARVFGNVGAGQNHVIDIQSSGLNGQIRGPVRISDFEAVSGGWAGKSLIHNTTGIFVSPTQADVFGDQNASALTISEYKWAGNSVVGDSSKDYLDNEIVSTFQGLSINGDINAALQAGSDIGVKISAAITQCSAKCRILIPPGNYSYSTTISLPLNIFGTYTLNGDPGAVLTYTGSGDAIFTPIGVNGPGESQLIIEGFQLNGNGTATAGIHLYPTNRVTIRNMNIQGFSNGDGIRIEGTNSSNIYDNLISNNKNGIHLIPTLCNTSFPYTCSPTGSGSNTFTPNAIHVFANQIAVNSLWAIWNDRASNPGGLTGSLNNSYRDNDLENNGTSPNGGAIYDTHSRATVIEGNYFEGSPHHVVLGELGAGSALNTAGPVVRDNYFTTSPPIAPATKQYNIELQNTVDALIEGNAELGSAGIGSATNCFINAATNGETRTLIGRNAIFQNSTDASGNQICVNGTGVNALVGGGSATLISQQYQAYMGDQFFQINTAVTSESVGIANMTTNGSCSLAPSVGNTTAINAGTASIYANTSKVTAVSAGGITVTHPSGTAMTYDVICFNNPTGGFGYP